METKHAPQAIRLSKFITHTGMPLAQFSRECGFKSPRTIQSIYTDGKPPTDKALKRIVQRFPQLNYDWVLLGIGEMEQVSFVEQASPSSKEKSTKAGFSQIQKKLISHDVNLNELSLDLEKMIKTSETNMLVYTQTNAMLMNKIEQLQITQKNVIDVFIENGKTVALDHIKLIKSLDQERKERNEQNFDKLSRKIHNYLKESRDLHDEIIQNKLNEAINIVRMDIVKNRKIQKEMIKEKLDEGIKFLNEEMYKNAIAQTDFAIKSLLDKFSVKKLLPKLGAHKRVSKD